MNWLWIGFGGAIGAISRYGIGLIFANKNIPIATLIVNSLGSFLFGVLLAINADQDISNFYLFLTAGFLGAFTTFSTFTHEVINLLHRKMVIKALVLVSFHLLIIVGMILLGFVIYPS